MEFKGTKGKWKMSEINISDYKSICVFSDGEEQKVLLHIHLPNYEITEEELSNAKLIVSAPQLLKEHQTDLIVLTNWIERFDSVFGVGPEMQQELQDMINAKEEAIKKALK